MPEGNLESMLPISILLVGVRPRWVGELFKRRTDIKIVDEISRVKDLGKAMAQKECDVVVTALPDGQVQPVLSSVLFGPGHTAIVAITARGHNIEVYDHRVRREVAPEDLIRVIREVVHRKRLAGNSITQE
ncbi:MAG TPA: hypothetical protein PK614_06495 [Nitrospira sp.]|nr:hypothetical protein [Nitrospira sp.]